MRDSGHFPIPSSLSSFIYKIKETIDGGDKAAYTIISKELPKMLPSSSVSTRILPLAPCSWAGRWKLLLQQQQTVRHLSGFSSNLTESLRSSDILVFQSSSANNYIYKKVYKFELGQKMNYFSSVATSQEHLPKTPAQEKDQQENKKNKDDSTALNSFLIEFVQFN